MNKNAIKKFATEARRELISRVGQRALKYGISDKEVGNPNDDSVGGHLLSSIEKKQRAALIEQIKEKGYEQVMEEVAYTWFNRFSALRFMEVNGYLPTRVRVFTDENNAFKPQILTEAIHMELDGLDMEKVYAYKEANDNDELYKYLLITQCNALNSVLPGMFQKIADYTELLFPDNLLREGSVVQQMIELIPEDDWKDAVQIIGWLYQYYNIEQNELVYDGTMSKSRLPKELIPAATTIFTPDWAVRYMVENSLGHIWMEGHPDEELKSHWKYYLEETEQEPDVQVQLATIREEYKVLKPEDILCIDPCSGSGHILAYMFDVLVQIYEAYGVDTRTAVASIVENNIYGLDIDDRAAQLAYFAVMMKARQYDRRFFSRKDDEGKLKIPQPHVYAVFESGHTDKDGKKHKNYDENALEYFCNGDAKLKEAMGTIIEELHDAKEYGSIITVSQQDWDALYIRFEEIKNESVMSIYSDAALRLQNMVKMAEVLSRKYHVVSTNPPYLGNSRFGSKLDKFVKKNYLEEKSDLSMVMFRKALDGFLIVNGFLAFITTNSWMFLSRFEKLRDYVLNGYAFDSIVDFGTELFDGKVGHNPIVAWVNRASNINKRITAVRLVEYCYGRRDEKDTEFFNKDNYYYPLKQNFIAIPGQPITYSFSEQIINAFQNEPSVVDRGTTRLGMTTADNNKFLRLWFEVDINKEIFDAKSDEEVQSKNKKWVPYNKGGKYRKWYGNHDCVVNWENSGFEIKNFSDDKGHIRSTVPNMEYYFLPCATWSKISSGSIAFRYRPVGSIFDVAGACLYSKRGLYQLMGFLNSNVANNILGILSPTLNYEGSHIAALPIKDQMFENSRIEDLVKRNIALSKEDWDSFEFSWDFQRHPLAHGSLISETFNEWKEICDARFFEMKANEEELNRIFIEMYDVQAEVSDVVEEKNVTVNRADLQRDIRSLISYAVGCMFGRYSLDIDGIAYAGGQFDKTKYRTFAIDDDNILPISDDEYFEDDIVGRFIRFIEVLYGSENLSENLRFIAEALGGKGTPKEVLRCYFLSDFYSDHCASYAFGTSGKRPIYWLFDSGKKNGFKALIYMHRYQPDTIARIRTDYVHEQQARYRTAIADLENRIANASTSERVKLNKQLKKLNDQATEIHEYEEKIHHLADQMISIDLDDGVKKNYAIFQDVLAKIK